jgi:hypothetical protein
MTTLAEFKRLPRITIRTTTGWQSGVSCNSPARVTKAEIVYATRAGKQVVFGEATAKTKASAVSQAYAAALKFYDEE